jgi:EAL domain-containing protein (putative c-di-GMP-specific phosphodiesterase class I)
MIEKVLEETEYSGMYLGLELTENVLMESVAEVKEIFQRLRKKGVSFIIDDFGTGYSNLHYLMHYPITKLKIDKTFIESLDKDSIEAPIIKAIISMAHNLKMKVIAEGVETEEQLKFLSENQCDEVQGFFFSKPIEANAYTQLLKEGILTKNNLK